MLSGACTICMCVSANAFEFETEPSLPVRIVKSSKQIQQERKCAQILIQEQVGNDATAPLVN